MIINWIKEKLGIKDYTEDFERIVSSLANINARLDAITEDLRESYLDISNIESKLGGIRSDVKDIEKKIDKIPKEILVKNVLSI